MSEAAATDDLAAQAGVFAALLAVGRRLDLAGLLLMAAALLALVLAPLALGPRLALLGVVGAGLAEHIFALRTAFDRPIFAAWSRRWHDHGAHPEADLAAFDQALADAALRPASAAAPRPLAGRIAGARRLLLRQGQCLMLEVAAWLLAVLLVIRST